MIIKRSLAITLSVTLLTAMLIGQIFIVLHGSVVHAHTSPITFENRTVFSLDEQ